MDQRGFQKMKGKIKLGVPRNKMDEGKKKVNIPNKRDFIKAK